MGHVSKPNSGLDAGILSDFRPTTDRIGFPEIKTNRSTKTGVLGSADAYAAIDYKRQR